MLFNASHIPLLDLFLATNFGLSSVSYNTTGVMPALVSGFHSGEAAMRAELRVPAGMNPTTPGLPMYYGARISSCPLVAIGTLDDQGRPWTTVWGGERGFAGMVAQGVLGFNSGVDTEHDPVYEAFWQGQTGMVRPNEGQGKMMSALAIDLEGRDRVKLGGAMVAGSAEGTEVQMAMVVSESLGNCPKYLNKKAVMKREVKDASMENGEGVPLGEDALRLVREADAFFMSTTNGESMDTNYRGGGRGFVRVVRNDEGGVVLVYPEYSGNRLYQSLGNLKVNPLAGIVIPDFNTSDALYLTGSTTILVGKQASSVIAHTNLAVQITVTAARFVKGGLPFRATSMEESPYNPPIRHLVTEKQDHVTDKRHHVTASLARREEVTPTIHRYTFTLSEKLAWHAGQHVSLDFAPELDLGYEHMNDADPQSLNDDFVRTFTISSPPGDAAKLEITARTNGPATNFLKRHNTRVPLELGVLGFGGEAAFRMPTEKDGTRAVFVAGGVGITPLLAQAKSVLDGGVDLEVLWSVNTADLGLVRDALGRIDGLGQVMKLYVTGGELNEEERSTLGVKEVNEGRMAKEDAEKVKGQDVKFYLCAGQTMAKALEG